jgi:hypothetical protein
MSPKRRYKICWLWSLIIFLIQRSLLSAVFIPHEDFTPQKYVHSFTRGSAEGGYPLCGVRGLGSWDLVQLPVGKRALQNKWVYKLKEEDGGEKQVQG